jgi:hypothetical protein
MHTAYNGTTQQQPKQQFACTVAVAEVPPMLRMPKDMFQKEKKKLCLFRYLPLH